MSSDALSYEQPRTVTIGLTTGRTKVAQIPGLDPNADMLKVILKVPGKDGGSDETVAIPMSRVAYIAFHRSDPPEKSESKPSDRGAECLVFVPDRLCFSVWVASQELKDRVGFYASPEKTTDRYCEFFFFHAGINRCERKERLGQLLVSRGALAADELKTSLAAHKAQREVRLGDILIENKTIEAEAVQMIVEEQKKRRRVGRPVRLGELLVEEGLLTQEEIEQALAQQKERRGRRLGELLVEMELVDERTIAQTLAHKFGLPFIDLDGYQIDPDAFSEIPARLAHQFQVFPFQSDEDRIRIAMSDPLGLEAVDMLRFSVPKQIQEVIVTPSQLERYLAPYSTVQKNRNEDDNLTSIMAALADEDEGRNVVNETNERATVRLVNQIIRSAYEAGASDIHLEPNGPNRAMVVRFRVDGACTVYSQLPSNYRKEVISRVKIMSRLDIAERRKPQDGRMRLHFEDTTIELRVATMPNSYGDEDAVLRLLPTAGAMALGELDFSKRNLAEVKRLIKRPYGLILVAGPTGSGKTTTLHSMLEQINTADRKIWTAEDPVEIPHPGLRQVQVQPQIGFTFANAMRSFLRADPDVIMVGEMRDLETAQIAVRASLTGHVVFSTLHTNSAPDTITRLLDMGLDQFSFADALLAVLAQRLVRRVCQGCKEEYEGKQEFYDTLKAVGNPDLKMRLKGDSLPLWRGTGCTECSGTGYKGRLPIQELLVVDEDIRRLVQRRSTVAAVRKAGRRGGMESLLEDGLNKCLLGLTTLSQVTSVCSR